MGLDKNRTFVRKPYDKQLYKWSPQSTDKKVKRRSGDRNFFCDATPNSQGEDWITTYVYELTAEDGVQHRYAYVECDYVK